MIRRAEGRILGSRLAQLTPKKTVLRGPILKSIPLGVLDAESTRVCDRKGSRKCASDYVPPLRSSYSRQISQRKK